MLKTSPSTKQQNRRPLNDFQRRLLTKPSIASQMPVIFGNANSWTELNGYCKGCDEMIKPELFRGQVSKPFPNVAVVDAVGICYPCKLVTTFHYRLYDDMRMSGKDREGKWNTWNFHSSWGTRLAKLFKQTIGFMKG